MPYQINFSKRYKKREKDFLKKHKNLVDKYEKVLYLLKDNPQHTSLRLHQLKGKLHPLYSISIDIQYRMTMEFYIEDERIVPVNIGTHDDVYK
ncbi:MAG: HigB toxin protein [uncultured Sulfurovum sp.]|uniref:HigB toxin protein n=1 Tax=uncultured Sulfurovum sp. TaxID=269237 RepID=A0A6S6SL44_9BACT|nr:MAG: HigB toxin protein [uncultured Sulfurovum sp.]